MDRADSARFDGIAICSGSKPNRLYGSGRFGRIADLVQIGSKVRRRRRADIAVAEVAAGWFADFWPNGESADTLPGPTCRPRNPLFEPLLRVVDHAFIKS